MIYRLFRWHRGEYYFDQKARVDLESEENIPPMSAESILMEGIQMIDEWPIIEKKIPNFGIVFRPTVELSDIDLSDIAAEDTEFEAAFAKVNAFAPPGPDTGEKIRLSREEAEVFLLLDGKSSVNEVVESSKLGEFHTCKALLDLLERQIIEPLPSRGEVRVPTLAPTFQQPGAAPVEEKEEPERTHFGIVNALLAVVFVGLIAVNLKDPLHLTMLPFFDRQSEETVKRTTSATRIQAVDAAVLMYYHMNGKLPDRLDDLVQGNLIDENELLDGWSRPYDYEVGGEFYSLSAHNGDGHPDDSLKIQRLVSLNSPPPPAVKPRK